MSRAAVVPASRRTGRSGTWRELLALVGVAKSIAGEPQLWPIAGVQFVRLAPRNWWRRPPFLPLPDPAYVRFRMTTMYGDPDRAPDPADVLTWLRWTRAYPDRARRPGFFGRRAF